MPIGISKSRWQEIQQALDDILDKPESERQAFLDSFRQDQQLYQELKKLMGEDLKKVSILDTPAADLLQSNSMSDDSSLSKSEGLGNDFPSISKYEILREIGRGGMGCVYLARHISESFERRVAIKVLSVTNRDPQIIQRFELEQRLLASLEHNHIAQIYEGGITQEGTPYFAMEYIEGTSIDRYCDEQRLTIEQRLKLVLQIIEALDFAHKNLIVHRDIKPSNILVNKDGNVKLVDFGIAKLVNQDKDSQLTQTGNQILTPGFSAPEQLLDLPITTATDVYLLGLVLYKILTGHQAYQDMSGSLIELVKVMSEDPPTAPSKIISLLDEQKNNLLSSARGVSSGQLKKKLSGDLDAIVLKCLGNKVKDRYASMSALRSDIESYFENKPISAQQLTFIYQSKKYLRRHWKGVSLLSSAILVLISYAYTVTVQSQKIQSALELSQIEQDKAQQVSKFMLDIFTSADPNVSSLNKMTAAELLNQGREKVLKDLQRAPEVQSHMLTSLGEVYIELSEIDKSIELLEKSLLIQRELDAPTLTTLAKTLTTLGVAYVNGQKLDQAEALFKESIAIHEALIAEEARDVNVEYAEAHTAYAQLQRKLGNYETSIELYQKSIGLLKQIGANQHHEMAVALNGLASVQQDIGQFESALVTMKAAIKIQERTLGSKHSYFTIYLNNLSILLTSMERYDEAFVYSKRALDIQKSILPEYHRYFAGPLRSLGKISHARGDLEDALVYFSQALDVYRKKTASNNYITAILNERLGLVMQDMNNYQKAKQFYDEVFKIHKEIATGERVIARSYHLPAKLALIQADLDSAEQFYEKALDNLPEESLHKSIAQLGFSQLLLEQVDLEKVNLEKVSLEKTGLKSITREDESDIKPLLKRAKNLVTSAMPMLEDSLPKSHALIAESKLTLGVISLLLGDKQVADTLISPALANLKSKPIYQFGHRKLLLNKLNQVRERLTSEKKH